MKVGALLSVAALVPGLFLMQSTGVSSVAVIDFDRAISETPAGQEAIKKLTAFETEQKTAIEAKQKEADDLESKLRTQDHLLTEASRTKMSHDLEAARTAVQDMGQKAQKQLDQMQDELLAPVEGKMATAVNAYAAERGVQIVLNSAVLRNGLIYVHDTADITTEIVRRMAINAKGVPPKQDRESVAEQLHEQFASRKWGQAFSQYSMDAPAPNQIETSTNRK
jgi:Skp family chaperone for outer membrane proteins